MDSECTLAPKAPKEKILDAVLSLLFLLALALFFCTASAVAFKAFCTSLACTCCCGRRNLSMVAEEKHKKKCEYCIHGAEGAEKFFSTLCVGKIWSSLKMRVEILKKSLKVGFLF